MRNDPCLKKTRIKSRSGGIAQVRLSDALVGILLRLIRQIPRDSGHPRIEGGKVAVLYASVSAGRSLGCNCQSPQVAFTEVPLGKVGWTVHQTPLPTIKTAE
jgi:hypothetical protein